MGASDDSRHAGVVSGSGAEKSILTHVCKREDIGGGSTELGGIKGVETSANVLINENKQGKESNRTLNAR